MAFVPDASITACWAFQVEDHPDAGLAFRVDRTPDEEAVLRLARTHRLSVYDAAYLELARREALSLATLDADLKKAAAREGVTLIRARL